MRESVIYQEILQEGLQEGWQKGRQEGRQEGQLSIISRLLQRKFGTIDPLLSEKIHHLPNIQLEELADLVFDWKDSNDLENWINKKIS